MEKNGFCSKWTKPTVRTIARQDTHTKANREREREEEREEGWQGGREKEGRKEREKFGFKLLLQKSLEITCSVSTHM